EQNCEDRNLQNQVLGNSERDVLRKNVQHERLESRRSWRCLWSSRSSDRLRWRSDAFPGAREIDCDGSDEKCKSRDDLEINKRLPRDAAQGSKPLMSCNSCRERAQDKRSHDGAHKA